MNWFSKFLTSSIGQKLIMSLTGIFLILFLVVHLIGNLQLLLDDGGKQFNLYAKFMTTNPLIKTVSYLLYISILLHAVQGILIWLKNRAARGSQRYKVPLTGSSTWASRNMWSLGIIIFIFIMLHLWQFWLQMKLGYLEKVTYVGYEGEVKDLFTPVVAAFSEWWYVVIYVVSMVVIAFHLWHGFQSAFQTLGWNHKRFGFLFKWIGYAYAILIPLGFAIIPVYMYFVYS